MLRNVFLIACLLCSVCAVHWEIREVESSEDVDEMPDEIKTKLFATCEKIGLLKDMCKKFIQKYVSTLVEELSTTDGPKTICTSLRACKSKSPFLKDFILSFDQAFDNL